MFPTEKAITHRFGGTRVDHTLPLAAHVISRRPAPHQLHTRLLPFAKRLHPRVARTLVLGIVQGAVFGLPLLLPSPSLAQLKPSAQRGPNWSNARAKSRSLQHTQTV